jgi:hypothetical protein
MNASGLGKLLTGVMVIGALAIIDASAFATSCSAPSSGTVAYDVSKLVGNWTGESICTGNNPNCHDEKVIYRISESAGERDKVTLAADKIVDGKPELMYVLDFKYDAGKGTLVGEFENARYHGVWEYTVKGNVMEGTLTLLPGKTIARRVLIKKDE